jgi:hypothetical protein
MGRAHHSGDLRADDAASASAASAIDLAPRRRAASASTSRGNTAASASSMQSISSALNGKLARLEELEARLANGGDGDKAELDKALSAFFDGSSR